MKIKPKPLTPANFRKYGKIIEYPPAQKAKKKQVKNLWRIVDTAPQPTGWRIAYLIVRDKKLLRLEHHPKSKETFEPVKGRTLLYVSTTDDPNKIECFQLTKPIILKTHIWHGIVTLDREAEIKLTENAKVKCIYWRLGFTLSP